MENVLTERIYNIVDDVADEKAAKVNVYTPHPNQTKIIQSPARFKVIVCGRRFGKTTFAVQSAFISALLKPKGTFWYIAPTYRQAKSIAWRMLMDIYRDNPRELFEKHPNESNLQMILSNGAYLELKGADNEDSLRGVGLDGVILDEYAQIKPHVWEEVVQPMLTDKKGWAMFIGTPKGYNHFWEMAERARKLGVKKGWEYFHFTTYDNPHLSEKEIERHKAQMTEDYFAQEYLADFRKFTGLVYKEFDRATHIIKPREGGIPPNWPRWRAVDAGFTNPFAVLWITQDPSTDEYIIYDEHYLAGQTTRFHAEIINGKSYGEYYRGTYIDPSARQIMQDLAQYGIYCTQGYNVVGGARENYRAGIAKVAELLKVSPVTKRPSIFVYNHCTNFIKEIENYHWQEKKEGRSAQEVPAKVDDHAMDALRYFINSVGLKSHKPYKEKTPVYAPRSKTTGY